MAYCILFEGFNIGGTEYLTVKLANEFSRTGDRVYVLYEYMDPAVKTSFNSDVVLTSIRWAELEKELTHLSIRNESLRAIVYLWSDYVRVFPIEGIQTLYYEIIPSGLNIGKSMPDKMPKRLIKKAVKPIINKAIDSGHIIAMEPSNVQLICDYYGISNSIPIVRIPEDVDQISDTFMEEKASNQSFSILSIARAEFPFKGYLLGLIRWFADNCQEDDSLLTIVSYGRDYGQLQTLVDSLEETVKSRITLVGKTPYECLKEYIKKAKVYVGMGTTLLDASKYGTPSIAIKPYTYNVEAECFFWEDPCCLAPYDEIDDRFTFLMNTIRQSSVDEYKKYSQKALNAVIEHYSSEKTCSLIKKQFTRISGKPCRRLVSCIGTLVKMQYYAKK